MIANGAFAEVREGRLRDMVVAVRTLRADRQTDQHEAQKVSVASDHSVRANKGPCNLGFLQGMHRLDERLPSQPFRAHRCRHQPSHRPVLDDIGDDGEWEH